MAGKRYLEIKVCKYSVTGETFCSSLKQKLQKVFYELNLQRLSIGFLDGNAEQLKIIHASTKQDCFLLWVIHLSRRRHIHNWITTVHINILQVY